jgi:hypothetical protein
MCCGVHSTSTRGEEEDVERGWDTEAECVSCKKALTNDCISSLRPERERNKKNSGKYQKEKVISDGVTLLRQHTGHTVTVLLENIFPFVEHCIQILNFLIGFPQICPQHTLLLQRLSQQTPVCEEQEIHGYSLSCESTHTLSSLPFFPFTNRFSANSFLVVVNAD